jgi:hypothetical protein
MRMFLVLFRFLASLRLAVILIAAYAAVIAGASVLEKYYGTSAIHFAVYETRWFLAINILLAINVLSAVLIRFPWQRRRIGFVITHLGILTLMAGCLLSWRGGIEARLPVVEGHSSGRAYQDSWHLLLEISSNKNVAADKMEKGQKNSSSADKIENLSETVRLPFVGGPFDWDDYKNKLFWFPWRLARRTQGVLYDRGGVRLEALDYDAEEQEPRAKLRLAVDGVTGEFWLTGCMDEQMQADGRQGVESPLRRATVAMAQDYVDLGFLAFLREFQGRLDPGSGMASNYSSLVDFLAGDPRRTVLREKVTITLNAPVDFTDPRSGRTWRLFQSGFDGPWKPGSRQFQAMAGNDRSRDRIYLSILSLSYDPGRALKYTGCLLIVLGIAVIYYTRLRGIGIKDKIEGLSQFSC